MEHIFYHGTSSLFLDSIKETGLGGRIPSVDCKLLELLQFLYLMSEYYLKDDFDYLNVQHSMKAAASQVPLIWKTEKEDIVFNYRHTSIYLSYGETRAMIYAVNNHQYGSELLSMSVYLYRLLKKKRGAFHIPSNIDYFNIAKIETQQFTPIVIGIKDMPTQYLKTEHGESAEKLLGELEEKRRIYDHDAFWKEAQFCNFELMCPIPISQLAIYKIIYSGKLGTNSFRYSLEEM